jgi:hypothetical protein
MTAKNIIAKNEIEAAVANLSVKPTCETCRRARLKLDANACPDYFII